MSVVIEKVDTMKKYQRALFDVLKPAFVKDFHISKELKNAGFEIPGRDMHFTYWFKDIGEAVRFTELLADAAADGGGGGSRGEGMRSMLVMRNEKEAGICIPLQFLEAVLDALKAHNK